MNLFGLIFGPFLFLLVMVIPIPGLASSAHHLAAVMALVFTLWITEALPLAVTALLGTVLVVLLGIAPVKTSLASYADPIIFLFMGSFFIAEAMRVHGLHRRIALRLLSIPFFGRSAARILIGCGVIAAILSMWMSNSGTTAMMLPVVLGIIARIETDDPIAPWTGKAGSFGANSGENPDSPPNPHRGNIFAKCEDVADKESNTKNYATGLLLMIAYGGSVGGLATPVGTPPNLVGIGFLENLTGIRISFFSWMTLTLPLVVVMFFCLSLLLGRFHGAARVNIGVARHKIGQEFKSLGTWTQGEKSTLAAFLTAVVLWLSPSLLGLVMGEKSLVVAFVTGRLDEGIVAILAASLLFILPANSTIKRRALTWKEAVRIDWGTLILFGGGMMLGRLMFSTGLATFLGEGLIRLTGVQSLWGITGIGILLSILVSEATSNTASANMMIPLMIAIAQAGGVSPVPPALGACLGSSFGFMLPVSTPPNAIVYGTGRIPMRTMMRTGIFFDVIGFFVIWGGLRVLYPLLGW